MTTRFTLRFMLCCFSEKLSDQISQQSISKINETEVRRLEDMRTNKSTVLV